MPRRPFAGAYSIRAQRRFGHAPPRFNSRPVPRPNQIRATAEPDSAQISPAPASGSIQMSPRPASYASRVGGVRARCSAGSPLIRHSSDSDPSRTSRRPGPGYIQTQARFDLDQLRPNSDSPRIQFGPKSGSQQSRDPRRPAPDPTQTRLRFNSFDPRFPLDLAQI